MEVSDDVGFHVIEKRATSWNIPAYYDDLHLNGGGCFDLWYVILQLLR